jgi:hypothetical protein
VLSRDAVEVVMVDRDDAQRRDAREEVPDITELCPNCGRRGERRKCKLICTNPRCGTHIIMACVD